jgi:hypothetical protein
MFDPVDERVFIFRLDQHSTSSVTMSSGPPQRLATTGPQANASMAETFGGLAK